MKKGICILVLTLFMSHLVKDKVTERNAIRNAGAYSFEKYNIESYLEDDAITRKVKLVLGNDTKLNTNTIKVDTRNGLVRLSGKTNSKFDRERAVKLTLNSRGVKAVKDSLNTKE